MKTLKLAFLALLLFFSNVITSQTVDDYLKPVSNIQAYYFNREELMFLEPGGVTFTSELNKNALGLIDYKREGYNIRLGPNDNIHDNPAIVVYILVFSSRETLNKFISSSDKETIFTPFRNHFFLIGDKTLTRFDWLGGTVDPLQDKPGYRAYLRVLNSYRKRLDARLLIPPGSDFTEESYFDGWRKLVSD